MNGKWIALVVATSFIYGGCKKTPTVADRKAPSSVVVASKTPEPVDFPTSITRLIAAYEWEPTVDRAAAVWNAFEQMDSKLQQLRNIVAREAGGRRAEAEIERIELQRLKETTMARFSNSRARLKTLRPAQDTLTASLEGDGMRAAASAVLGPRAQLDNRFRSQGLTPLTNRLPLQTP